MQRPLWRRGGVEAASRCRLLTCAWRREGSGDEEGDEMEREREREEPEDGVDGAASGPPATRGRKGRGRRRGRVGGCGAVGQGSGKGGSGTILMAHHPSVRHKYIHTNGAPHRGAPLVFFLFQLEPTGYVPPELIHIKSPLLARLVSSQLSHQEVLGSTPRLHNFFSI